MQIYWKRLVTDDKQQFNHMIVIIPELNKQSHMISLDRNRDPDSNYGGKYKEEAKHARGTQETLTVNIYNIDSDLTFLIHV